MQRDSKASKNYTFHSITVTGKIFENGFSDENACKVRGRCCCSSGTSHRGRKEMNMGGYIYWTPPQLTPSDGSDSTRAKLWRRLLRRGAEVRNCSGEEDELALQGTAPSEPHGSKVQGTTEQTYRSQQQHGQVPGSAALFSVSLAQHKCS